MKKIITLLLLVTLLPSCSHQRKKADLEQQIASEHPARSQSEIALRGHEILLNHPSLSAEQKEEMRSLYGRVFAESLKMRDELGRTKAVFFRTLFDPKQGNEELGILRKKLVTLNNDKMNLMLQAVEEAKKILGKDPEKYRDLLEDMHRNFNAAD